jgi:trk system potassium uptake protein TrkH
MALRARALAPGASARLVAGICLLIAIGTFFLSLPGMTTRPLTFMDLLFTSTSAVTVTGLNVVTISTDFTRLGQIVILLLVQTGGLGFIIIVVGTLRLLNRRVSMLDRLALVNELGLNSARTMWDVLKVTLGVMLIIETIGALLLYVHWLTSGIVPADEVAFYAIFHAVMAFCNAGFDLFFGLARYPQGLPSDIPSLLVLGALVVAGGLGFAVYLDLIFRRVPYRLTLHSKVTILTSTLLLLGGAIGLIAGEYRFVDGVLVDTSWLERLVLALFQSASARTAGFPGLESFEELHQSSRLLLTGLMFIGSGPGSMGGGITTGTFAVMVLALVSYVRGQRKVSLFRRALSDDTIRRALAVVMVSLGLVGVATWLLLLSHSFSLDTALFEIVSAFSTTGLSLGITDDLNTFGRIIVMFVMTWGRLGAMTLMIALLQRLPQDRLLQYPEETLLVG